MVLSDTEGAIRALFVVVPEIRSSTPISSTTCGEKVICKIGSVLRSLNLAHPVTLVAGVHLTQAFEEGAVSLVDKRLFMKKRISNTVNHLKDQFPSNLVSRVISLEETGIPNNHSFACIDASDGDAKPSEWVQDYFLVEKSWKIFCLKVLVSTPYLNSYRNEIERVQQAWKGKLHVKEVIDLAFQGGNLLVDPEFIFWGYDDYKKSLVSKGRRNDPCKELKNRLGYRNARVVIPLFDPEKSEGLPTYTPHATSLPGYGRVGDRWNKTQLIYHLDVFMTICGRVEEAGGKFLIFLGALNPPNWMLDNRIGKPKPSEERKKDLIEVGRWLDEISCWLSCYKDDSGDRSFQVVRVPLFYYHFDDLVGYLTYNNGLFHKPNKGKKVIALPRYRTDNTDPEKMLEIERRVEAIYNSYGIEVGWVEGGDYSYDIAYSGSLRCQVKVLDRE